VKLPNDLSLAPFWRPRYWPTWALLGFMHVAAKLPKSWQLALGRCLGRVLRLVKKRQESVARRNIELCFRELGPAAQRELLDRHFEAVGMSFIEMAIGWFTPIDRLLERVSIHGREHLEQALAGGRGTLLVGGHFTALEVGFAVLEALTPRASCMYRPQRHAMMDVMIRRGRYRFAKHQISRDNVRALVRTLRDGYAVGYLPDQTYLGNQSELIPFFGEPAVTNTATSKLVAISGCTMLPYFFRRLPNGDYRVDIGPPLADFPSGSSRRDAERLFGLLEDYIRLAPEQYLWLYKKFKGRPPPLPDPYTR
jgi:Kdo2-lipid IVA lauroyltransferase/acyltransferase